MKHTPWEALESVNGGWCVRAGMQDIGLGRRPNGGYYGLLSRERAHLIAAAPELLEALREAITWDGWDQEGVAAVWLKQAQAAIAKAMGEG